MASTRQQAPATPPPGVSPTNEKPPAVPADDDAEPTAAGKRSPLGARRPDSMQMAATLLQAAVYRAVTLPGCELGSARQLIIVNDDDDETSGLELDSGAGAARLSSERQPRWYDVASYRLSPSCDSVCDSACDAGAAWSSRDSQAQDDRWATAALEPWPEEGGASERWRRRSRESTEGSNSSGDADDFCARAACSAAAARRVGRLSRDAFSLMDGSSAFKVSSV